jgi:hypothetical protein
LDVAAAHPYLHHILHFFLITYVLSVVLFIIPLIQIARKAGLHYSIALLALAPGIGTIIALYILAFSPWKPTSAAVTHI